MKTSTANFQERLTELADQTRIRLLRILEEEELSVGEIGSVLQLPQSSVSRQLKVLTDGGWLVRRTVGPSSLFRLLLDDLTIDRRALWVLVREQSKGPAFEEDQRRLRDTLAQRKLDSQAFFGRVAGEWDDVRMELFGHNVTTLGLFGLLPHDWVVADLGCGTGNAAEVLAPHVERVVAVDQSAAMLEAARKRLAGVPNVDFLTSEIGRMTLPPKSVDAAVCMLVLHHLDNPSHVFQDAARALRRDRGGGVLLVVDMLAHERDEYRRTMGHRHLGFSPATIEGWYTAHGFDPPRIQPLPTSPEARGPGLFAAAAHLRKS